MSLKFKDSAPPIHPQTVQQSTAFLRELNHPMTFPAEAVCSSGGIPRFRNNPLLNYVLPKSLTKISFIRAQYAFKSNI